MQIAVRTLSFFLIVVILESVESTMYMKHGQYLEPGIFDIVIIRQIIGNS